jgi:protein Tex
LEVKGLGSKAFQQAAGFLRIREGDEGLDNTFIHPESYAVCYKLLALMGLRGDEPDLPARVKRGWAELQAQGQTFAKLAAQLGTGVPTLEDMLANLLKPGRDPREDLPAPILRTDVLKIEDLREGMVLKGTVRNVVDFGAFVDIGVKQDGLVHVSEMGEHYVRNPLEVVGVGDVVDVRVIGVDLERGRVALSMKKGT